MASVVPTVLADNPGDYAQRLERAAALSPRIHIDFSDGTLTPNKTLGLGQIYGPVQPRVVDLHLMVKQPTQYLESVLSLQPNLAIVHAEANEDLSSFVDHLHALGVVVGLAFLPETAIESVDVDLIKRFDHVLLFTGTLGQNSGQFHASQLDKVPALRAIKPELEISVDGGVGPDQAVIAIRAGINVLDVGAAIQSAADPQASYNLLAAL